jgi:hypothetical protein
MVGNDVQTGLDDVDRDTATAVIEFALGMNPNDATGMHGIAGLPVAGVAANGRVTLTFVVPENPAAAQSHGFSDTVIVVQAGGAPNGPWTTIATKTLNSPWTGAGTATVSAPVGGFVTVTIQDTAAPGTLRLMRLGATWTP